MKTHKLIDQELVEALEREEQPLDFSDRIRPIAIADIDEFPGHPFSVRMDADMEALMESIEEVGVVAPVLLRNKDDGRYETVSGHRRIYACKQLGIETVPAEIRNVTDDEAILLMVDSNLQRMRILPSEKAKAYRMRMDAMKRLPGRPKKDAPSVHHFKGKKTRDIVAEETDNCGRDIQRYLRLNFLIPALLEMADTDTLALRPAVLLSYLGESEQQEIVDRISETHKAPTEKQAAKLKAAFKAGTLTSERMTGILLEKPDNRQVSFAYETLAPYLPPELSGKGITAYILDALRWYCCQLSEGDFQ